MAVAPLFHTATPPSIYAERRARLCERLGPGAALLLMSPPERLRNGDAHYKYRQDSDILYLTGFAEPGAAVLLRPGHATPFVLFVRPRDPAAETWTGRRAGVEGAVSAFGADAAFSSDELDDKLAEIVAGAEEVHYPFGREPEQDAAVGRLLGKLRAGERRGRRAPVRLCDARLTLHEMRLLKSPEEIATLRRAAEITAEAHTAAMPPRAPAAASARSRRSSTTPSAGAAARGPATAPSSAAAPTRRSSTTSRTRRRSRAGSSCSSTPAARSTATPPT